MDLYTMDSNYKSTGLVEGYESFIWTERYSDCGDFTMVFADVAAGRAALPLETRVSLIDSPQIFMVENHVIEKDDEGRVVLSVSGRSMESITDRRTTYNPFSTTSDDNAFVTGQNPATALAYALLGMNLISTVDDLSPEFIGDVQPQDILPSTWAKSMDFYYDYKDLLEYVTELRTTWRLGVEPFLNPGGPLMVSFYLDLPTNSNFKVLLRVYEGKDRTVNQTVLNPVILTVANGDFDDNGYVFSRKGLKNVAYVFGGNNNVARVGWGSVNPATYSGFNRRVLYVSATDIPRVSTSSSAAIQAKLKQRGLGELAKHRQTVLMDGVLRADGTYKYRKHYKLGDLVTVVGNYGITQDMRVAEYIRSEDKNGEVAFPTLISDYSLDT